MTNGAELEQIARRTRTTCLAVAYQKEMRRRAARLEKLLARTEMAVGLLDRRGTSLDYRPRNALIGTAWLKGSIR
jgi:hypothetical protein